MTKLSFIEQGLRVLDIERQALFDIKQYVDDNFHQACQLMYDCSGRIIIIGMGKSGHIGHKIAATLASTGSPAFFVHHVVMLISNSGETSEVLNIIPVLKRLGAKIISMTGNTQSTMATLANVHVCIKVEKEACSLGLAPTASTTATLAMGDAMAVALLEARGFTADDFALSHPGGSLGKRLLLTLKDVMHSGVNTPIITTSQTIKDALIEMTAKGLGMTAIVDDNQQLAGLFTDGDLRRILEQRVDIHTTSIDAVMTKSCTTATQDMLAAQALNIMEHKRINGLIIINEHNQPIGALNMQDLLKAGVL